MPVSRRLWRLTGHRIVAGGHSYWRHDITGHWWSKDKARHGGSVFKVYEMVGNNLVWIADADKYGDYIYNEHKGTQGKMITLDSTEN
jgi:hypothetical protein